MKNKIQSIATIFCLLLVTALVLPAATRSTEPKPLAERVRHELVMLPYYNVFDNFEYKVEGNVVTLYGQVTRPTLRSDAENVVRRLPGVARVVNNVEVLPLSSFDNGVRLRVFRAIYSQPGLDRYALGAMPGIHIIVKNGNVTLEGVVGNEMERNLANIRANGVFGVFSVTNNLRVAGRES